MESDEIIKINKAGIRQSLITVKSFITTAECIHRDGFGEGTHIYSFHLLMANILELLPKIYIWTQSKNLRDRDCLIKEATYYKHDLLKLYRDHPKLMEVSCIREICFCVDKTISTPMYNFILDNNKKVFVIDSESARFGMFSANENIAYPALNTSDLLIMVKNLKKYVEDCVNKLFKLPNQS